jgi:hypothetical protein
MRARAAEGFAAGGSIDKPSTQFPQSPETANLVDALIEALSKAEFTAPVVLSELEARKRRLDASRKFGSKR